MTNFLYFRYGHQTTSIVAKEVSDSERFISPPALLVSLCAKAHRKNRGYQSCDSLGWDDRSFKNDSFLKRLMIPVDGVQGQHLAALRRVKV